MSVLITRIVSIAAVSLIALSIAIYALFLHVQNHLVGAPLPALQVRTLSDKPEMLVPRAGRVGVIVVFATWCDDCQREMPEITAIERQFHGRASFAAIDQAESSKAVARFLQAYGFNGSAFIDPGGNTLGVFDIPTIFITDKKGIVRDRITGGATAKMLRAKIDAALSA